MTTVQEEVSLEDLAESKELLLNMNWARWGLPMPTLHASKVFARARLPPGKEAVVMDVCGEAFMINFNTVHPSYHWYDIIAGVLVTLFTLPHRNGRVTDDATLEQQLWKKMLMRYMENGRSKVRGCSVPL